MTEGFTGMNPTVAKMDIDEFENTGMGIYNSVCAANRKFMNGISKVWYSQNSTEFGKVYTNELYLVQNSIKCLVNNYIVRCVKAYNDIAASNGAESIQDDHVPMENGSMAPNGTGEAFDDFLTARDDGVVGMDVDKVNKFLEDYSNEIQRIISNDLNNFPLSIAFYDPDNSLKTAFKEEVDRIISELDGKVNDVYKAVNAHITDEEHKTIEAVTSSTEAMGGTSE